jgi:metal-sulfur cluster biosynthetic enzyme
VENVERDVSETATGAGASPARADERPSEGRTEGPTAEQVRLALRKVKDPELNLNIIDLGLVYDIAVEGRTVRVDMSLTSPGCPAGPEIVQGAEQAVRSVPGVEDAQVNIVWQPMWSPERIEPRVRAYLGF